MRPVSGYLSDDGNFFELKASADKHDAEMLIRQYCVTHTPEGMKILEDDRPIPKCIDAEKVLSIIEALADPILEFVNASREEQKANESRTTIVHPEPKYARGYQADEFIAEAAAETILEQSPNGHEPMSDMGRGSLAEKL